MSQAFERCAHCFGAAAVLFLLIASAPAFAETPAGCGVSAPTVGWSAKPEPSNLTLFKRRLIDYRCKRYDAELARVDRAAAAWIARRAPHVARPALVLDIDETSLSNWTVIYHNDFAFFREGDCN